ncbi:MAG: SGNH/GDSL hydrolase family protein [Chlamydiae bacterium]|nr:SGNH/GDSL hydrolase family protein [Chlamydiota bacterium]
MMLGLLELFLHFSGVWIGRHTDTMFKIMTYDENLGWRMKRNLNTTIDLVDKENIPIRSNSEGFWDKDFVLEKPSGELRVVFLGDSFTWGYGVQEEERFSSILARKHPEWDILNFGMPGYGTDQAYLVWKMIAARYRPDIVVLTIYKNDFFDNVSVVNDGRQKPYFEFGKNEVLTLKNVPVNPETLWQNSIYNQIALPYTSFYGWSIEKRSRILHWMVKNSDLVRLAYSLLRHRDAKGKQSDVDRIQLKLNSAEESELKLMRSILQQFNKEIESSGQKLVIAFAGPKDLKSIKLMEYLNQSNIKFVDVTTDPLALALKGETQKVYLPYSGHWTPAANQVAADVLEAELKLK